MKRFLAMLMACTMLLLCACGGSDQAAEPNPDASAAPEATPEVTATPEPAAQYVNPLNGALLDEPYTGRVFASTICNTENAIPHVSLNEADVVFEMFVNGGVIRNLALFSDIKSVEKFGSVRSTRPMFHQLAGMYDLIVLHSGGSNYSLNEIYRLGYDNFNIDMWDIKHSGASYRDKDHGRSYEATLFGYGEGCYNYAESQGMRLEQPADMDYGLRFADEGTPAKGEAANTVTMDFNYYGNSKVTEMKYDAELDKYIYNQYGKEMRDLFTDEPEAFTNVIAITAKLYVEDIYQKADYAKGGEGWYACGGKLIPIKWTSEDGKSPIRFFEMDGTELKLERGNTYIGIMPDKHSTINWG